MSCDEQLTMGTAPISPVESLQGCVQFQAAHARLLVSRSHERNLHGTSNAHSLAQAPHALDAWKLHQCLLHYPNAVAHNAQAAVHPSP